MREMTVAASLENIPRVTAFVLEELAALGCPNHERVQITVAIDEAFTNIASYAYAVEDGTVTVRFAFDDGAREAVVTFIDRGMPFDPMQKPDPDVTLPPSARRVGGLGIFLVKQSMDAVEYDYRDGCNILTLRKKI